MIESNPFSAELISSIDMEGLGERLQWLIDNVRVEGELLSAREVGRRAGVSGAYVSNIVNGRTKDPSVNKIADLAMVFDYPPAWLAFGGGTEVFDVKTLSLPTTLRSAINLLLKLKNNHYTELACWKVAQAHFKTTGVETEEEWMNEISRWANRLAAIDAGLPDPNDMGEIDGHDPSGMRD